MKTRVDYFSSADGAATPSSRIALLREACEAWRGTPFRQRSLVRGEGGGVDCAGFVGACFAQIGAIPDAVAVPPYALNHAEHSEESMLRSWFETPHVRTRVRRVDEDEAHLDGDFVFPVVGRTEHHLGIRIGVLVYHIARPSGWCAHTISQLKLAPSRYRLMEARGEWVGGEVVGGNCTGRFDRMSAGFGPPFVPALNFQPSTLNCGGSAAAT